MVTCPHCGKPGIKRMRKIFLGPGASTKCKSCGKRVVLYSKKANLALIPVLMAIVLDPYMQTRLSKILFIVVLSIVSCLLYLFWVPLLPDNSKY